MKYAVIQLVGKQYKVVEGEELTVNAIDAKEGSELKVNDVLLVADGKSIELGTPLLKKATVTLKVVSHQKNDKIRVAKYKAKSRYRKVHGHRQAETTVKVASIS